MASRFTFKSESLNFCICLENFSLHIFQMLTCQIKSSYIHSHASLPLRQRSRAKTEGPKARRNEGSNNKNKNSKPCRSWVRWAVTSCTSNLKSLFWEQSSAWELSVGALYNWNVFSHLIHYLHPSPFKLIAAVDLWASVGTSLDQKLNFVQWLE